MTKFVYFQEHFLSTFPLIDMLGFKNDLHRSIVYSRI